jgi:hypothetical protein
VRQATIIQGDALAVLRAMPAENFDACLCDPPYGISFMNALWDHGVPGAEVWREVLRVLKPGAFLAAFGGTRTWHRLAVAIEDAGFEVRDTLMYLHGMGFPKSGEVIARGIDARDAAEERRRRSLTFTAWMRSTGITSRQIAEATGGSFMASHYLTDKEQPGVATAEMFDLLRPLLPAVPPEIEDMVRERTVESENLKRRKVVGRRKGKDAVAGDLYAPGEGVYFSKEFDVTAPHTSEAAMWRGYSPTLKPAWEPVILAMRPLSWTFAENALQHGVAGLNVDGCRIGTSKDVPASGTAAGSVCYGKRGPRTTDMDGFNPNIGRWPANVILSHLPECVEIGTRKVRTSTHYPAQRGIGGLGAAGHRGQADLPESRPGTETVASWRCHPECPVALLDAQADTTTTGVRVSPRGSPAARNTPFTRGREAPEYTDSGGASRFFYTAKVDTTERAGTKHPTLKPVDLCAWLAKLLLPPERPGGERRLVIPFAGAGSEAMGALRAGWESVTGIENDPQWVADAERRIAADAPLLNRVVVASFSEPQCIRGGAAP